MPSTGVSRAAAGPGLRAADFERVLAARPCARTEHFVLHHLPRAPQAPPAELSTAQAAPSVAGVDDCRRFGLVVPKRHARRAVTRNLIKRQGRALFAAHTARLRAGDWLLRLRGPFAVTQFVSAASAPLRSAVRSELQVLFASAVGGPR